MNFCFQEMSSQLTQLTLIYFSPWDTITTMSPQLCKHITSDIEHFHGVFLHIFERVRGLETPGPLGSWAPGHLCGQGSGARQFLDSKMKCSSDDLHMFVEIYKYIYINI